MARLDYAALNSTVRYLMFSVFAIRPGELGDDEQRSAAAGEAEGLPADVAMQLARATVCGAGELAFQSPESAAQLRINVTSPGGTTAAALGVLMDAETGFPALLKRAVKAAADRGRELGK